MTPNLNTLLITSLIPFIFGLVWFHPKVFGEWTKSAGLNKETNNKKIKPIRLLLTIILNFLISLGLFQMAVHQASVFSLVGGNVESLTNGIGKEFMETYGSNYLSFKHGITHGVMTTILFVVPIIGYITIFDKKSSKYFWVYCGYWLICLALMGGILCQWGANSL